jgi:ribosome biogenesis protein ERB1
MSDSIEKRHQMMGGRKAGQLVEWMEAVADPKSSSSEVTLEIKHPHNIKQAIWHKRGDYFGTLAVEANGQRGHVLVHQLSKKISQNPFKSSSMPVEAIRFHPTRPQFLLIASFLLRTININFSPSLTCFIGPTICQNI